MHSKIYGLHLNGAHELKYISSNCTLTTLCKHLRERSWKNKAETLPSFNGYAYAVHDPEPQAWFFFSRNSSYLLNYLVCLQYFEAF